MNCRSARRRISDPTGRIFSAGSKKRLEQHLRECASCRTEASAFRAGIEALKHPAVFDDADFTEAEWRVAIRAAVAGGKTAKSDRFARFFRPSLGCVLGVLLVGAAIFFGVRHIPWLIPKVENHPSRAAASAARPRIIKPNAPGTIPAETDSRAPAGGTVFSAGRPSPFPSSAAPPPAGDVPSFTWISEETGLQIVWFINDSLNLEE